MENSFELGVIGAGPAGYVAAIKAAQLGMSVALFENREVGGTCLNRGCIPTKTLLHTALLKRELEDAADMGLETGEVVCSMEKLYARKGEVVERLRSGIQQLIKANKIELIAGDASVARGIVACGGRQYSCKNILIATGSVPACPPIQGIDTDGVVTSDGVLDGLTALPEKLVIVGGGVIGVEFATVFNALGSEVTIIEALDRLLPPADKEISQNLAMLLKKRGVDIHTGARVCRFESGPKVVFEEKGGEKSVAADLIIVATGRRPNTDGLFADGFSVKTERGAIVTDKNYMTDCEGIYAAGDVRFGAVQLAHAATAEGVNAVCAIKGETAQFDGALIPSCVYTSPEIAFAGLNETEAQEKGMEIKVGKALMSANGKSVLCGAQRGFIKLVFDKNTDALIGASLMCERATDIIGELVTAMAHGATSESLSKVVRPHPTFEEAVSEAAEAANGRAVHTAPKR